LGTPAITTRGLKEKDMEYIGEWLARVIKEVCMKYQLPEDKAQNKEYLAKFREEIKGNKVVLEVREEVKKFCEKFPLYTTLDY
jgi:glycine hydroxymethyltransferase